MRFIFLTPVTLKHQTDKDSVHSKQGSNHEKFERSCFNGIGEKANVKVYFNTRKYVFHLP